MSNHVKLTDEVRLACKHFKEGQQAGREEVISILHSIYDKVNAKGASLKAIDLIDMVDAVYEQPAKEKET